MGVTWMKTNTPGVRCYEYPTRKYGIRKDRYFTIRYKVNGKRKEEGLGWASEGCTERKASKRLSELKENNRTGTGAKTLSEKREVARKQEQQYERENITFATVFKEYIEDAQGDRNNRTNKVELLYFNKWIAPLLGHLPMKDISPRGS
ncbi:MAG: hypothetical protein LBR78_02765 [Holosporales bacterium]|jgi:hypothetical protein|nr:hypothetical protein [Holosporales bacterium]